MIANKNAFLFPGQGAQYLGMGKELCESSSEAKALFSLASDILGYSMFDLINHGPEDKLTQTKFAQPAIFTTSITALRELLRQHPERQGYFFAGLSLGEFSALVAAKAISFEDGLMLVKKRAEAMERASIQNPGTMASILGMDLQACLDIAKKSDCEVANINAPDQIVLSGTQESISTACRYAEESGAKRAIQLKVGGAFHSKLMEPAKKELQAALIETKIKAPAGIFIPNASAIATADPETIRELLAKQLTNTVQWVQTMALAQEMNIEYGYEIGPGKVLKGLARKCGNSFAVEPVCTASDIERLKQTKSKAS